MHLLDEIYQALLIYLQRFLTFFAAYLRALVGGTRATLLARIATGIGLLGGGVVAAGGWMEGLAATVVMALGWGCISLAVFLIIVAFPGARRFWVFTGITSAAVIVALYFLAVPDTGLLVLASALLLISVSSLFVDDRFLSGSIRGSLAEWRVNACLKPFSKRGGGLIANGVFPIGEVSTEIDHILITRSGVFVIETKGLSGVIRGLPDQDVWYQVLGPELVNEIMNPIRQNDLHVRTIQRIVGEDIPVHNVVVFTNARFGSPMPASVVRVGDLKRYLKGFKFKALSEAMVKSLVSRIEAAVDTSREARDAHIMRVASRRLTEYAD